jgi:hypothetical protein
VKPNERLRLKTRSPTALQSENINWEGIASYVGELKEMVLSNAMDMDFPQMRKWEDRGYCKSDVKE